ncbi:MAG: hypothetical protein K5786_10405 [Treponema sp.]|nr:hypothetical protein [Treponema sp.]MCR4632029.1 hypothetical protein [Treponema sp.]
MYMCICGGCGKILENSFHYCPWCGFSRIEEEKKQSIDMKYEQYKEKYLESRSAQIEKLSSQLENLEKELSVLVLSAEMAK